MGQITRIIQEIDLEGTNDGCITIGIIAEPYGAESQSVASIGISLQSNASEPDWKVHIPKENIDAVISALQEAKKVL
ncbi:MAG: hypothetical protein ACWGHH_04055 [Sulfurovaceae bacterium]